MIHDFQVKDIIENKLAASLGFSKAQQYAYPIALEIAKLAQKDLEEELKDKSAEYEAKIALLEEKISDMTNSSDELEKEKFKAMLMSCRDSIEEIIDEQITNNLYLSEESDGYGDDYHKYYQLNYNGREL